VAKKANRLNKPYCCKFANRRVKENKIPANKPKRIRGKTEISGFTKNKSIGCGVGFVTTTSKDTSPKLKPSKVADRVDNNAAPNNTGK
jgi:hypothetical protein